MSAEKDDLTVLYEAHADSVYRYVRYLARADDLAFDLMQDTFVNAARYYKKGKVHSERAWLLKIAHRLFLASRMKNAAEVPLEPSMEPSVPEDFTEEVVWKLLRHRILERLGGTSEVLGRMFVLRVDQNLTLREIGEVLDIPLGTIRRHFEKIVRVIEQNFGKELGREKE